MGTWSFRPRLGGNHAGAPPLAAAGRRRRRDRDRVWVWVRVPYPAWFFLNPVSEPPASQRMCENRLGGWTERLRRFCPNRRNRSVQPSNCPTAQTIFRHPLTRVAEQPIPARPDSKRTRPGREPEPEPRPRPGPGPEPGTGTGARAHACMCGHSSLLFARENSKYPKGTPFVLNFLYLYTTNFHSMVNVGLNAFRYL